MQIPRTGGKNPAKKDKLLLTVAGIYSIVSFVRKNTVVHEWLSGGVSPCQGEGRGFESRLVLSVREAVENEKSFFYSPFLMRGAHKISNILL